MGQITGQILLFIILATLSGFIICYLLMHIRFKKQKAKETELQIKFQTKEAELEESQNELKTLDTKILSLGSELEDSEENTRLCEARIREQEIRVSQLEGEITAKETTVSNLEIEISDFSARIVELETGLKKSVEFNNVIETNLREANEELNKKDAEFQRSDKLTNESLTKIASLQSENRILLQGIDKKAEELAEMNSRLQELDALKTANSDYETALNHLQGNMDSAIRKKDLEISKLHAIITGQDAAIAAEQSSAKTQQAEIARLTLSLDEITKLQLQIFELEAKISELTKHSELSLSAKLKEIELLNERLKVIPLLHTQVAERDAKLSSLESSLTEKIY